MNLKLFIEGLEPGTYPGALIIDSDGEIVFRPGEQMVTETVGAVSRTVPVSLYTEESEITNKVHPRFVAGYEAGMADAKLEAASDSVGKINLDYSPSIDGPIDIKTVQYHLTNIGQYFVTEEMFNVANATYNILAFVNSQDKQLHDLRGHAITDDKFVARSAHDIVKAERDSARQANSMYFSEVNYMKYALHTHLMNVERLEKELAVARKVSMDRAEALNNMTNHDVQQRRIVDAKNTILDEADEIARLNEQHFETRRALIKAETERDKYADDLANMTAAYSEASDDGIKMRAALSRIWLELKNYGEAPDKPWPAKGSSLLRPATTPPGFA